MYGVGVSSRVASLTAMVWLPSHVIDPADYLYWKRMERRCAKRATLDGGVAITDFGLSHSDRTLELTLRNGCTESTVEVLREMVEDYGQVILSTDDGVYSAIARFSFISNAPRLTLDVVEKLS